MAMHTEAGTKVSLMAGNFNRFRARIISGRRYTLFNLSKSRSNRYTYINGFQYSYEAYFPRILPQSINKSHLNAKRELASIQVPIVLNS